MSKGPDNPLVKLKGTAYSEGRSYAMKLWRDATTPDINKRNSFNDVIKSPMNRDSLGSSKNHAVKQVSSPRMTGSWYTGKPGFTTPKKSR